MAKHVEVTVSCDNCGARDKDVQEFSVYNSKGRQVILDLHPKCHAEVYGPGLELADDKGQVQENAKAAKAAARYEAAKGTRICLLCPETRDTDWNLRDHMRNDHGLSGSMVETYGTLCPVDGESFERIGHHIRQEHKDVVEGQHYSHAFVWAKEHGDPHGVVAKQIAELKRMATTKAA